MYQFYIVFLLLFLFKLKCVGVRFYVGIFVKTMCVVFNVDILFKKIKLLQDLFVLLMLVEVTMYVVCIFRAHVVAVTVATAAADL